MKNFIKIFLPLFIIISACSSYDKDMIPDYNSVIYDLNNSLAIKFLQNINTTISPDSNICFSPIGLTSDISILYNASGDTTTEQIRKTLDLPDNLPPYKFFEYYQSILNKLNSYSEISFEGTLIYCPYLIFNEAFKNNYLNPSDINVHIVKPENGKTDYISSIIYTNEPGIPSDKYNEEKFVGFYNKFGFNAKWKIAFDTTYFPNIAFYGSSTTVNTKSIITEGNFRNKTSNDAAIIELPYENENFCMYFIMPKINIDKYIQELTIEKLYNYFHELDELSDIQFVIPKLNLKNILYLDEIYSKIGLGNYINNINANFYQISTDTFKIKNLIYESNISFYNSGKTSVEISRNEVDSSIILNDVMHYYFNKPFLFLLYNKKDDLIFCIGKIGLPK